MFCEKLRARDRTVRGGGPSTHWAVNSLDTSTVIGEKTHIAVDTAGHVAISYCNATTNQIRCARLVGGAWIFADVGDATGPYVTTGKNSIALRADGSPVVLCHKADVAYYYTSWTGTGWTAPLGIGWIESAWASLGCNSIGVNRNTGGLWAALACYDSHAGSVLG